MVGCEYLGFSCLPRNFQVETKRSLGSFFMPFSFWELSRGPYFVLVNKQYQEEDKGNLSERRTVVRRRTVGGGCLHCISKPTWLQMSSCGFGHYISISEGRLHEGDNGRLRLLMAVERVFKML